MNITVHKILAALASLCAASALATTGVWTNTAASGTWTTASNWENAYAPLADNDSASFPSDVPTTDAIVNPIRMITMPSQALTLDTISGTAGNTLSGPSAPYTYSFLDAADFAGTFKLGYPHTIAFRPAAGETAKVRNINALGKPFVSNADGTLEAGSIYGNALFDKAGAGTLRILSGGGPQTRLNVREASTVELAGAPSDLDATSLDGLPAPASWFDASEQGSLSVENGQVTKWIDKRDATAGTTGFHYLALCTDKDGNTLLLPTLASAAANGLDAVDFGAVGSGFAMKLSSEYPSASELFIAYENNSPINHGVLFGDTLNKKYNVTTTAAFDGSMFSTELGPLARLGEIRRDGNRIWWDDAICPRGGFHTLMIANSGNGHRLNTLGFQRGGTSGGMKVGEVIIYKSTHLTTDERRRVLRYLAKKWCSGDNAEDWELGGIQLGAATTLSVPAGRTARVQKITTSTAQSLTVAGSGELETAFIGNSPKGKRSNTSGETGVKWNTADPMPVAVSGGATLRLVPGVAADTNADLPPDPYAHFDASDASTISTADGAITEWRDVRDTSTMKMVAYNSPELLEGEMNGKPVVSTKGWHNSNAQPCFNLYAGASAVSASTANCREAFVAGRLAQAGKSGYVMLLGNTNRRTFYQGKEGGIITGYYDSSRTNDGSTPQNVDNYIAIDGVPVDPRTYEMTTNDVVVSLSFREKQTWNALSRYGNYRRGGARYGEIIVYDRSLTPQERRNVEAYLLKKWRGIETHPENAPSRTGAMSLVSGATLDIAEGAGLAVQGNLSVADGATISLGLASGASAPLTVTGTATFAGTATISVDFDGTYGEFPLVAANAVSGNLANISVVLPASAKGNASLKQSGGDLVLKYSPTATVISFR